MWHEHGVAAHLGLQAHRSHLLEHVVACPCLRGRAGNVCLRRECAGVRTGGVRARTADGVDFERTLGGSVPLREARHGGSRSRYTLRTQPGRGHAEQERDSDASERDTWTPNDGPDVVH